MGFYSCEEHLSTCIDLMWRELLATQTWWSSVRNFFFFGVDGKPDSNKKSIYLRSRIFSFTYITSIRRSLCILDMEELFEPQLRLCYFTSRSSSKILRNLWYNKRILIKLWCLVGFLIRLKQDSFMGSDILDDYQKTQLLLLHILNHVYNSS